MNRIHTLSPMLVRRLLSTLVPWLLLLMFLAADALHAFGQNLLVASGTAVRITNGAALQADTAAIDAGGTLTLDAFSTLRLTGDLTSNGTLSADDSSLTVFANDLTQSVSAPTVLNFGSFSKSGTGLLLLFTHCNSTGVLQLTGGNILTGTFALTHTGTALSRTGGFVVGNLTRVVGTSDALFPIGSSSKYLPVTARFSTGQTPVSATVTEENPAIGRAGDVANPLLALWKLQSVFPPAASAVVRMQYPNSVRQAGFDQAQAFVARWDGNRWQSFRTTSTPSLPDADPSSVTATAVSAFNEFAVFWGADDTPLPVVLQNFTGTSTAEGIELKWNTASENGSEGFLLWRKLKAQTGNVDTAKYERLSSYETNESLKATNSPTGNAYRYIDKELDKARYSYRLEEVSRTGVKSELRVIDVESRFKTGIRSYALYQNFPNPFNPSTTVRYDLKEKSRVQLFIYNVLGQKVLELVNAEQERNQYEIRFDASKLASGAYFYRLVAASGAGNFVQTKKMLLIK